MGEREGEGEREREREGERERENKTTDERGGEKRKRELTVLINNKSV